uniref:Putative ribonuclease H-like domain-containing protein n=1 Tax=Tanacetum cinerariifolium TaxID=118510 RepID=A0A6L2P127_TANCI|nr:putative ribonuclease H-like domain-containing protein [Tanacetum cinerariifolium]
MTSLKKVVVTEAAIREVLRLDDAEGVDCLPNKEIFAELARMGYEKPSTKLTFYKAFFLSQWKFLIYTILQLMMLNALPGMSLAQQWHLQSFACQQKVFANMRRVEKGFSGVGTPLFKGMLVGVIEEGGNAEEHVQDVADDDDAQGANAVVQRDDAQEPSIPSLTPPTPPPQPPQDLSSTSQVQHTSPQSPQPQSQPQPQAQQQAADFPMMAQALEITKLKRRVKKLEKGNKVRVLKLRRLKKVGTSQRIDTSEDTVMDDASNQRRMIDDLDKDDAVALMDDKEEEKKEEEAKVVEDDQVQGRQAEIYKIDMDHASKVLKVVTAASEIVTAASTIIFAAEQAEKQAEIYHLDLDHPSKVLFSAASATISAAKPSIPVAPTTVAAYTRRRKGVIIRDPEYELSSKTPAETSKLKDKGKGILIKTPKPMKKKDQIELDAEYARKLQEEINKDHEEINKDIDCDAAIDHCYETDIQLMSFICFDDLESRNVPSEWRTHALIWRYKTDLEVQSLHDLFNSLKIYEAEVKSSSSTGTSTQNIAFVSSSSSDSINEPVSAAPSVFVVCAKMHVSSLPNVESLSNVVIYSFFASQSSIPQLDNDDLKQIDVDDLEEIDLKWQMAMLTMRARLFFQRTRRNLRANRPTSMGFDMSKVECYNCHMKGHFAKECRSPKGEEPTNYALMVFSSSSSSSDTDVVSCSKVETFMPPKPDLVFNNAPNDVEIDHPAFHTKAPQNVLSFVQSTEQVQSPRPSVQHVEISIPDATPKSESPKPTGNGKRRNRKACFVCKNATLKSESPKPTGNGKRRNRKACFVCKSLDHLIKDCDYHEQKMAQPTARNHAYRGTHKHYAHMTLQNPQRHMVPAVVLSQCKPVPITAVRPVNTVVPKTSVTRPKQVKPIVTKPNLPTRRHINHCPPRKSSNSPPRVTAIQAPVVNVAQGNPQHALKDKEVIDSRCSRHMIGNMSYLSDFEKLNGGYVSFGGNPKGGKISGKGTIRTGKLYFDDVYFIKELKFNLFSVSQMCDKKNSVLFTDTECLVLSPNFKLPDANQVLLRVPRENNIYNVNLKNIVSSRDLTCLFAKATIDESNLWHRRLGHLNFKTMNKLVKGNFVRGLPTKVFENDHTCVACKKGKQHRASCKTKPVSSVDQPLYRLYMDLFRPTFVKSLNKKSYCLVVLDDYSRFTWVFFLATKDETSPILKTFITGLENQLSLQVKVIRSDNGSEFKNNDLNQFYGMKGIKREFSVPRTLQQNGIAERKNRTLNEAARTMVLVTKPHNKTPYELLHGRTPSIGFMRHFGCPVTILNTLDSLDKFDGKVDEGFLVGYSDSNKAFRVFNSRTHIVQETLHVNFLENKPNVAGSGPTWLFDIDTLTKTINYQPVTAGNQSNPSASFQDKVDAEKAGEEIDQQYMLLTVWSSGSINPQNTNGDAAFDEKEPEFDEKKPESEVNVSPSSGAQSKKHDDKTKKEAKGKSHVESLTGYRILSAKFEYFSDDSINEVNAASTLVPGVGQISPNSTNTFSVAGPLNAAASTTYGKSSCIDASQLPAYLSKSDASEGFNQIIDFLNGSSIKYALTLNPNIYVSCIKQFWTTVAVKMVNDVTRLQALVDKKKVVVTEATIRDALRLGDAEGVECLPNEEIFAELARIGYEKPSTKLTFYKAFFSSQWKFLIHTILQCMSAKRTSWSEFSSSIASAVIYLSSGRKFNSKYIFESLVRNVDSSSKFYMYPRFLQLMIRKQVGDLSTHTTKYTSPSLKVFANIRRVGKGFYEVETPLFEGMLVAREVEEGNADENVENVNAGDAAEGDVNAANDEVPTVGEELSIPSLTPPTPPPQPSHDIPSTSQAQPTPP